MHRRNNSRQGCRLGSAALYIPQAMSKIKHDTLRKMKSFSGFHFPSLPWHVISKQQVFGATPRYIVVAYHATI